MSPVAPDPLINRIAERIPLSMSGKSPHPRQLADVAAQIVRTFQPRRIVLFGSYAKRATTVDSDVDLMVEMETESRPVDQAVAIRQALDLRPSFPLDILVRRPTQIAQALRDGDYFIADIVSTGIVLYEADDR